MDPHLISSPLRVSFLVFFVFFSAVYYYFPRLSRWLVSSSFSQCVASSSLRQPSAGQLSTLFDYSPSVLMKKTLNAQSLGLLSVIYICDNTSNNNTVKYYFAYSFCSEGNSDFFPIFLYIKGEASSYSSQYRHAHFFSGCLES